MYNKTVKDHFANPRNAKDIHDADAVAEADNPVCGDIMKIYLKVSGGMISDVGVKTRGCAAAIAAGSVLSEIVLGAMVNVAAQVDSEAVRQALGGLPRNKAHAGVLAADVLRAAIEMLNGHG